MKIVNPERISSETSIDMGEYYLVYNFDYDNETKCYLNGKEISPIKALEHIKYDKNYECRYYKENTKKIQSTTYVNNDGEFILAFAMCNVFLLAAYIFAK